MKRFPSHIRAPVLVAVGYGLLILAWAMSNSPGSSPDEPAHLVKALGAANGQWRGQPAEYEPGPEFGVRHLPWINSVTRSFSVPNHKTFGTIATCNAFRSVQPSTCIPVGLAERADTSPDTSTRELSHVGSYQPYVYAPIGVAARAAPGGAAAAVLAGRIVVAVAVTSLLALAVAALWSAVAGAWSLMGLMAAISPMVIFLGSSLSPNGIEIAGGIAMSAGVIRLTRGPHPPAWAAVFTGAVAMALARTTGAVWVVVLAAFFVALAGPSRAWAALRDGGKTVTIGFGVVAFAVAASLLWQVAYMPAPPRSPSLGSVLPSFSGLPELMRQAIGVFGWLDAPMPTLAYVAWRGLLLGLLGLALLVGSRRERWVLAGLITTVIGATVALEVLAVGPTGFGTQARYSLAVAVAVPLLAGEIIANRRERLNELLSVRTPSAIGAFVAGLHVLAWYSSARRHGVGSDGPVLFIGRAEWSPPGGWAVWALVAVIGALLCAAGALLDSGRDADGVVS